MESYITIIVPFFNESNFIEKAVTDLAEEKFEKEILLVNDGSTDNSLNIARKLNRRI